MPTYQYACTECGHAFEQFQSFSDDALTVCPECDGRLRKVFNAVGVVFKGSGFYRTDSRGKESTSTSTAASSSSSSDGSSSSSSTSSSSTSGSAAAAPAAS
jgi:putative FmdB family regulatory protein